MRKRNYKGRCVKRTLSKCEGVVRTYSRIQYAYADRLESDGHIRKFLCNVPLKDSGSGDYCSDFVCIRQDGEYAVRECVERDHLMKPQTVRLLDESRNYWMRRGVKDWGIVIDGSGSTGQAD